MSPLELIDLARYPLHQPDAPALRALIDDCRAQLRESGVVTLPGFLTPQATALMVKDATELAPLAHRSTVVGNAYLEPNEDETLPVDHPRRMTEATTLGAVAYDQIPSGTALRELYEWDGLLEFLGQALGKDELHRYADPMGALNVAVMGDGDYLRWHFDQTDFVVSIALQEAEAGGDFEYAPLIRKADAENYREVRSVIRGESDKVRRLPITPGTMILFEGRNSLHRVTTIRGERLRLVALLGYDTKPGVTSTEHLRYMRYGRA